MGCRPSMRFLAQSGVVQVAEAGLGFLPLNDQKAGLLPVLADFGDLGNCRRRPGSQGHQQSQDRSQRPKPGQSHLPRLAVSSNGALLESISECWTEECGQTGPNCFSTEELHRLGLQASQDLHETHDRCNRQTKTKNHKGHKGYFVNFVVCGSETKTPVRRVRPHGGVTVRRLPGRVLGVTSWPPRTGGRCRHRTCLPGHGSGPAPGRCCWA
jgi:hypothetical protein